MLHFTLFHGEDKRKNNFERNIVQNYTRPFTVFLQGMAQFPNVKTENIQKKIVLLRERKRHTTRCVVSARSVVLAVLGEGGTPVLGRRATHPDLARGVPYLGLARGYPILTWLGGTHPDLAREVPHSDLPGGYPILTWPGDTPSWPGQGYPVLSYPPGQDWGTPQKGPGTSDLGKNLGLGYPLERTWDQWPGKEPGTGVPPPWVWTDRHLWKQYLPHPSDAGGKNLKPKLLSFSQGKGRRPFHQVLHQVDGQACLRCKSCTMQIFN